MQETAALFSTPRPTLIHRLSSAETLRKNVPSVAGLDAWVSDLKQPATFHSGTSQRPVDHAAALEQPSLLALPGKTKKDKLEVSTVELTDEVVDIMKMQHESRCRPLHNIGRSFLAGPFFLPPISFFIYPVTVPISMVLLAREPLNASRPDALRLHGFQKLGIVSTRRDSEGVVHALKNAGVLGRGRQRAVLDAEGTKNALKDFTVKGEVLTSEQVERIATYVRTVADEQSRRLPLIQEKNQLAEEASKRIRKIVGRRVGNEYRAAVQTAWKCDSRLLAISRRKREIAVELRTVVANSEDLGKAPGCKRQPGFIGGLKNYLGQVAKHAEAPFSL